MRPIKINGGEFGGANQMENESLAAVQELWNECEIHCLILVSLFLQVFLFLFAGLRRRTSSSVLRTVLWLAYLLADSVAIFVLGHLAVHASRPRHHLMSFWAPFVLVHLGGQDTITAFSKQDNELWRRHLLSLVTQVSVAGYVVARASWPDKRLRAAMVLVFLSGLFKYAGRVLCLYLASPARVRTYALVKLSLKQLKQRGRNVLTRGEAGTSMVKTLDMMSKGSSGASVVVMLPKANKIIADIMTVPLNDTRRITLAAEDMLPGMLEEFLSRVDRQNAYEHVGALLVHCYRLLYTKSPLREGSIISLVSIFDYLFSSIFDDAHPLIVILFLLSALFLMLSTIFPYVAIPIALALFAAAEKGDQLHTSRADITVSYLLLVGAIVMDVSSVVILMFSNFFNIPTGILHLANYIQPAWTKKHWSEELGQYSLIKRHTKEGTACMSSIWRWFGSDVTHISITKHGTPIKTFVLDSLLHFGARKEWNCASSRGQLALQMWMEKHQDLESASPSPAKALEKIIIGVIDFPSSVLIWHIATDICYYFGGNASTSDQVNKHKQMTRALSNYIMYLVFKCGVMLTSHSQIIHDEAHHEIRSVLSNDRAHHEMAKVLSDQQDQEVSLGEKDAIMKLFKAKRKEHKDSMDEIKKEESNNNNGNAADSQMSELRQSTQTLYSSVLPRACALAQGLISINDETERWFFLASVWLEMLYYTAPRCGGAFHYEHLSTGGEFVTHVLLLMYYLGPFMPAPDA